MGEEIFVKLRDCFTAGYTLPQYCIDNGIKKPLFVSEKKFELFLWEVNSQFKCDKRLQPQFCFIDKNEPSINIHFSKANGLSWLVGDVTIKNITAMNFDNFDKIILLTKENLDRTDRKIIRFVDLERFIVQRKRERNMISTVGDLCFERTYCKDVETGEYRYLLDEIIKQPKHERFTPLAEAKAIYDSRLARILTDELYDIFLGINLVADFIVEIGTIER